VDTFVAPAPLRLPPASPRRGTGIPCVCAQHAAQETGRPPRRRVGHVFTAFARFGPQQVYYYCVYVKAL
jgi:hypothetical protein